MLSKALFSKCQSFSWLKNRISEDHYKILHLCLPEKSKYFTNSIVTLLHASLFMYLPKVYTDINYLMDLKVSNMPQASILYEYGLMMGKWSVVFALIGVLTYKRRYDFLDISNRIGIRMRSTLFKKMLESDLYKRNALFQTYLHHLIADVQTLSSFTGETVFQGMRGLFFLIGGSACLLYKSPLICVIAAITMGAFNIFYKPKNLKLRHLKEEENRKLVDLSEYISQRFYNIRLVKICHTEAQEQLRLSKALSNFYQYATKVAKVNGFNIGFLEGAGIFSFFTLASMGSLLISLEISDFSLIQSSTYALMVSTGFRTLVNFNTELMKIMGVYKIIEQKIGSIEKDPEYNLPFDVLHKKYLEDIKAIQAESAAIHETKSEGVTLRIQNLSFHYTINEKDHVMYDNYNEVINAGDIVALAGPSGVGKSTLLNLVTKLSDPSNGEIFFDDVPISSMSFKDIQHKVSYVTQENFLFKGTLKQNLQYGNQGFDCSEENLLNCLKITNAYDFVMRKGGLEIPIQTKGSNLSGGQKQRIIMARALVKHPRLLLLDEATAGVDSESEKIIIENIKKFRCGMTVIIITHKMDNFLPIISKIIQLKSNK